VQKVSLPGLPAKRAADYQLDGFDDQPRYARVIYVPQETKPDRAMVEVQAFEIDADGRFMCAPNGAPSRTNGSIHVISMTGMGDTHTLVPGFVRVVGDYNADNLPEGAALATELPESGEPGDMVYIDPTLYRWDIGALETIMQGKANDLAGLLRNSEATVAFTL
jgi:hypothetical protein